MEDHERRALLDRLDKGSAAVGERVPEEVTVQGTTVRLREFVFEARRTEELPAEQRERVDRMLDQLRRERLQRRQRLEDAELSHEEGQALVEVIIGLDRAINALEGIDDRSFAEEARRNRIEDYREWVGFLQQVR